MIKNLTAIVIRLRLWGDKDLLVSLLNEDGERINAVVKGAGVSGSKRRGHLEQMNLIKGTLYSTRDHHYLQSVECQESHRLLKNNLDRILHAGVLMEVVEQSTLPEDPNPALFELLVATLAHLNEKEASHLAAEIGLLKWAQSLGILPSFKVCSSCHISLGDEAHWDKEKQALHCSDCTHPEAEFLGLKYRKALEFFKVASFKECSKIFFKEEELQKLSDLIPYLLRVHLDRPLKSLALLPVSTYKPLPIQA